MELSKVDITDGNNKLLSAEPTVFNEHGKEDSQIIKHTLKKQKKPTLPILETQRPEKSTEIEKTIIPQLEQIPKTIKTYLPKTDGKAENSLEFTIGC